MKRIRNFFRVVPLVLLAPGPALADSMTNSPISTVIPNASASVEGSGVPGIDGGHWFIWNGPASFDSAQTLRIDRNVRSGTGTSGATYKSLWVNDWNQSTTNAGYEWGFTSEEHNFANAQTGAQNVASAGYMFKEIPTNTVATTGASGTGLVATITFAGGAVIPVGYSVLIAGMTPSGYNGTYKVTASSAGSVSFASTTTGAQTVAGTIVNTSVGASWGGNFYCEDKTSEPDPIASCIGLEVDVTADSATTDANKQRVGMQIVGAGPVGAHVFADILMGSNGSAVIDNGLFLTNSYGNGIDFSHASFSSAAELFGANQNLCWTLTAGTCPAGSATIGSDDVNIGLNAAPGGVVNALINGTTYFGVTTALNTSYVNLQVNGNVVATGPVKAQAFVGSGTAPTNSGSCAINTQVGGATAGSFKANGACAAGTITFTFAASAPNGWSCTASDLTTPADAIKQTGYTAGTATFVATMAAGDLATFGCMAF
jgi:hypothetical protein